MTTSNDGIEEQAERELARMEAARAERNASPDKSKRKNATPSAQPRSRFESLDGSEGRRAGVYWFDVREDRGSGKLSEAAPVWVCSPLCVAAQTRDACSSEWGRLLVFPDRSNREHRWAMPMALLAGSCEELRGELLRQGLEITSDPNQRRRLHDYIQFQTPQVTARCVTRTGWHLPAFVLPTETIGDTQAEPIIFQTAAPEGITLGIAGTFDAWCEHVAAPCAGNSRLVLALSAAFAGPCIGLLNAEGGGLHFRGGSSSGKSTALAVAASVFGPSEYARTWRHTDNALESVAAMHSDLLLILDEIGQLDPKHAGAAAYLLANGQGKGRSRRDGSARAPVTFRVLFLSAGEIGLAELVTAGGGKQRAGQEVRVIDLPADAGVRLGLFERLPDGIDAGAFADRLKRAAATHYGHALPAMLRQLTDAPDKACAALRATRDALADDLAGDDATGQVRRVAQRFALIGAAGELATAYGLTGWPQGEAERAAHACFTAWIAARGTKGNAEPFAMLAQVRAFLEAHGDARFSLWTPRDHSPRTINRAGFRDDTDDGPTYYIEREVFKREICNGFDPAQVARVLIDAGALVTGSNGEATRKERLPDGRNARVYRIGPELWNDSE